MVGKKLKGLRWLAGLSLRDVQSQTGISFSTLSRIERGVASPDLDTLYRLADFYGVDETKLLGREPTQEETEQYLIGHGYDLEKLRTEINALIDELKATAGVILQSKEQP